MKLTKFASLIALGLVLAVAATGCKKRPTDLTILPNGARSGDVASPGPGTMIDTSRTDTGPTSRDAGAIKDGSGIPFGPGHEGWIPNAEIFKAFTVYFDFDSSAVKSGERAKVKSVADHLKSNATAAVRVEGHCDERGTEEYNRALGERRALAVREELVKLGVDSTRVDTISFGKDRPADPGHTDDAHRKNRRGEFILLTPPAAP